MKDVSHILSQVADLFGQKARENTLNKCFGKHLGEIELILNSCRGKEKILDVGGGSGINLLCLKRINNELELNLIDNFDEYTEENPSGPAAHILQLLENNQERLEIAKSGQQAYANSISQEGMEKFCDFFVKQIER